MKWFYDLFGIGRRQRTPERYRNPLDGPMRLEAREVPASLTWNYNGGVPGDWSTVANWISSDVVRVPTADDDVVFPATATGVCKLTANAVCKSLFFNSGDIDLRGFALKIDAGAGGMMPTPFSAVYAGFISGGTLELHRGRLDVWGDVFGTTNLVVGPGNATGDAVLSVANNINGGVLTNLTVKDHGQVIVIGNFSETPIRLGTNIEVQNGGYVDFSPLAGEVEVRHNAVFTVREGGILDLNASIGTAATSTSYISNSGTVRRTTSGTAYVDMGLKNENCGALLDLNANGESTTLWFNRAVPGSTASVVQTHGQVRLWHNSSLGVKEGYLQEDGTLSVMGRPAGQTNAFSLALTDGKVADINGGSVILSDESDHNDTLLTSNLHFKFGAASTLLLGFHPYGTSDRLLLHQVTITAGAKFDAQVGAMGADPGGAYFTIIFMEVEMGNTITGSFTNTGVPGDLFKHLNDRYYSFTTGPWT